MYARFFKRPLDLLVASLALLIAAPVLLLVAVAVQASSRGPAIFRHVRVGRNGRPFAMLKFRTMFDRAPDLRNPDGTTFNGPADRRVTPLGRFLRATSLDELPQLINVLRGDMSLVGGRPELPEGVAGYLPHQHDRLLVRPGVTSWAMLHGRNNVPLSQRRDLDAWYAHNVSFRLDLHILMATIRIVLQREGVVNEYSQTLGLAKDRSDMTPKAR